MIKRIGTDKEDQGNDFIEEQLEFGDEEETTEAGEPNVADD